MAMVSICKGVLNPLFIMYSQTFFKPRASESLLGVPEPKFFNVASEGVKIIARTNVIMKIIVASTNYIKYLGKLLLLKLIIVHKNMPQ